jgi:hypothetical protein
VLAAAVLHGEMSGGLELPRFSRRNTLLGLAGSGIACPEVDDALVDCCLRYLIDSGFLPGVR